MGTASTAGFEIPKSWAQALLVSAQTGTYPDDAQSLPLIKQNNSKITCLLTALYLVAMVVATLRYSVMSLTMDTLTKIMVA